MFHLILLVAFFGTESRGIRIADIGAMYWRIKL
jgi:hypothetical protein